VVQRHLYGRHSKQKIKFLAIAEKNEANQSHFHALFDIPLIEENRYMLEFLQTWTVLDKGSSIGLSNDTLTARDTWFKQVYEVEGVVKYLFKNHRNAEKYEFVGMVL